MRLWSRSKKRWFDYEPAYDQPRRKKKRKKRKRANWLNNQSNPYMEQIANSRRLDLIENATKAERMLEKELKKMGIKYEFQKIIYSGNSFRIIDFYFDCGHKGLCVEIDGNIHFSKDGRIRDYRRTRELKMDKRIRILRFTNTDVYKDAKYVAYCIKNWIGGEHQKTRWDNQRRAIAYQKGLEFDRLYKETLAHGS